jgi:hypothetical protein
LVPGAVVAPEDAEAAVLVLAAVLAAVLDPAVLDPPVLDAAVLEAAAAPPLLDDELLLPHAANAPVSATTASAPQARPTDVPQTVPIIITPYLG